LRRLKKIVNKRDKGGDKVKKIVRDKHDCGKGYVWYILDTETNEKINTFYDASLGKIGFRKRIVEKILEERLKGDKK